MRWQPIDSYQIPAFDPEKWFIPTAHVLVWAFGNVQLADFSYTKTGKGRWRTATGYVCQPTHWMPLPPPPTREA